MIRILFAATPEIALPVLEALAKTHPGLGVLTNPDAPVGRSREPQASPVKTLGLSLGLDVYQPQKLDGEFRTRIEGKFDLLVSFAYGKIFGPKFLSLFPKGGVNIHPSLLPRWRGPSPLNAAILAGDSQTGLSVQTLALEMDAGDLIFQEVWPLSGGETAGELGEKAALRAAQVLPQVLEDYVSGHIKPWPQDSSQAVYCGLLNRDAGELDWTRGAAEIDGLIRGLSPKPGAYTWLKGIKLDILEASPLEEASSDIPGKILRLDKKEGILVNTSDRLMAVKRLQLASKKPMDFRSFINGMPDLIHQTLGERP